MLHILGIDGHQIILISCIGKRKRGREKERRGGEVGSTRGYTGEVNKEAMPEEGEGEGRKRGEVDSVPLLATSRLKYDHCLSVMRYHTLTLGTAVGGKTG